MSKVPIKTQILSFRNRELMQCLDQLGLSRKGRKPDLQARLLAYFGEAHNVPGTRADIAPPKEQWKQETAARVVQTLYNQMKGIGIARVPSTSQNDSLNWHIEQIPTAVSKSDINDQGRSNTQINCICGHNYDRGTEMIQCEADACGIWQHCECVGVVDGSKLEHYFCELCRAQRADPFWEVMRPLLLPAVRLKPQKPPFTLLAHSLPEVQSIEKTFVINEQQYDLLRRHSSQYKLHILCLKHNDPVPSRFHWPKQIDLRVNNVSYRPYGRNPSSKLGPNARDEQASIGSMIIAGRNRLTLTCVDTDSYLVMIQISKKRSMADVKRLMRPPETQVAALARVGAVLGGSGEGDDDDIEALSTVVSLRCPLSGSRIKRPVRFTTISSLQAFDEDTFLSTAERTRKWQDPNSLRPGTVFELQEDGYLGRVLACLANAPNVMEIEISPEALWRPSGTNQRWRSISEDVSAAAVHGSVGDKHDGAAIDDSGSDEESEGAELRAAAAAVASRSLKRKHSEGDIINLVSDDEDESDGVAADFFGADAAQVSDSFMNALLEGPDRLSGGAEAGPSSAAYAAAGHQDRSSQGINIRLPSRPYRPQQPQPRHATAPSSATGAALNHLATAANMVLQGNAGATMPLQHSLDTAYHVNQPTAQYSMQLADGNLSLPQSSSSHQMRGYNMQQSSTMTTQQQTNSLLENLLAWGNTGGSAAVSYSMPTLDHQLPGSASLGNAAVGPQDQSLAQAATLNGFMPLQANGLDLRANDIIELD